MLAAALRFQSEAPTIEYGLLGCQGMFAYLEKHDAARNMARFYAVDVQPNLFGQWSTVRQWGRIGRGRGQSMEEWHLSAEAAAQAAEKLTRAKLKRGYRAL